uniref:Heart-and neural crest derivatives-expressed protein 2 n=1 Tax=Aceria tosichella TaxID=561515 RepID=A0A6G1SBH9_9ACAR
MADFFNTTPSQATTSYHYEGYQQHQQHYHQQYHHNHHHHNQQHQEIQEIQQIQQIHQQHQQTHWRQQELVVIESCAHYEPATMVTVEPRPEPRLMQRVKANKKERRRTQSINQAFDKLRNHIPNVPSDTKLSKIKILRLAISYINHLVSLVNSNPEDLAEARPLTQYCTEPAWLKTTRAPNRKLRS